MNTKKSLEKDFGSDPSGKLIEDIAKNVRTMPQIKIDAELTKVIINSQNILAGPKKVNYKGEIISE